MNARLALLIIFVVIAIFRSELRLPFLALVALGLAFAVGLHFTHGNSL